MFNEGVVRDDGGNDFVVPDNDALRAEEVIESGNSGCIVEFQSVGKGLS